MSRPRQDVAVDGSCIEGTHPGWNNLMQKKACGIRVFVALSHDHVLRRNIRVSSKSESCTPFVASTFGSHHVRLVNGNNFRWNKLIHEQIKSASKTPARVRQLQRQLRSELPVVQSGESFGLAPSQAALEQLDGLLTLEESGPLDTGSVIKTECLPDADINLLVQAGHSDSEREQIVASLDIDPSLLRIPLQDFTSPTQSRLAAASATSSSQSKTVSHSSSSAASAAVHAVIVSESICSTLSDCKLIRKYRTLLQTMN